MTPTLRPDGSLLNVPGYDQVTQLYLMIQDLACAIPEAPSKDEALEALTFLNELLDEFPFTNEVSRSVALSALMTPVLRGAFPVAPLHCVTAPVAGSGKSYIIDLCAAIATGDRAPAISVARNAEETDKRIAAALLYGQPIISLDNVNGELGGDILCQAVERPVVAIRPLGSSNLIRVDSHATWYANGNNITVVDDMTRRVVRCSLDPVLERPELRIFKDRPLERVLGNRERYVAAILTISRAYVAAGCPNVVPPFASYEGWNRIVRAPLSWLGKADPLDSAASARSEDPVAEELRAVQSTWHAAFGAMSLTAGEAIDSANQKRFGDERFQSLYYALQCVCEGRSGEPDARRLGKYLVRHKDRLFDGLKVHQGEDSHSKQKTWSVRRA